MGLKLTPALRKAMGSTAAAAGGGIVRLRPVPGMAFGFIPGEPPTVTHQAKRLVTIGNRMALADDKALAGAIRTYMALIPQRQGPALAGPLRLVLTFQWSCTAVTRPRRRQDKPDWDNAAKTLVDVLASRGWMADDRCVSDGRAIKWDVPLGWASDLWRPGVRVEMITLPEYDEPPEQHPDPTAFVDGLRFFPFALQNQGAAHAS